MVGEESIAIIGGGITGLVLAKHLEGSARALNLFEASSRLGGWIESEQVGEFLLEHGPNTVLTSSDFLSLVQDLGLEHEMRFPELASKKRFLLSQPPGEVSPQLLAAPANLWEALNTRLLSRESKWRILKEPFYSRRREGDCSVYDFFSEHFGEEFTSQIISAVLGGIYAADAHCLSFESAFPRLAKQTGKRGSLFLGALENTLLRRNKREQRNIFSFHGGLEVLIERLTSSLTRSNIHLDTRISGIRIERTPRKAITYFLSAGEGSDQKEFGPYDRLLLTIPGKSCADLIRPIQADLAEAIAQIPYSAIGVMHLSIPRARVGHPLDGFGVLLPPHLSSGTLGVIFSSSTFPERAPTDHHLLTCFSGGAVFPQFARVDSPDVQEKLLQEITPLLGFQEKPTILSARYYPSAIPNYPVGHRALLFPKISTFENEHPKIQLVSQFQEGIGVPDRIRFARDSAASLL